jgi:hypothetical protein
MKYTAEIEEGKITLRVARDGDRTVSGKGAKPIIDINTDKLTAVAPALKYITLHVGKNLITGRPE